MARLRRADDLMTVAEFFAFTESRPDEERWELIDGAPILKASPSYLHQIVVGNLIEHLRAEQRRLRPPWAVLPGIGVRLSDLKAPTPDVLVRPARLMAGNHCDDMIVAFEVLSPSTADRDLRWKRKAYAGLDAVQHYVVVAQDAVEVVAFDRASGWAERRVEAAGSALDLPALGVTLPLAALYADTGLA